MKVSTILKMAMNEKGIKSATELSKLSGVKYSTTARAINDENVGIYVVVELLNYMGYKLKAEVIRND